MNISICIPTYNQANYIEQAIRSAAEQTLTPFEIIVSDDCSTDNTAAVLENLKQEIQNLQVFRQPQNSGIARNTDFCLRAAKGEYIVRLDSDDYLSNEYCKLLSQKLAGHPTAAYAHAAVHEVDEKSQPRKIRKLYRKPGFETDINALQAAVKGYRVAANIIMFRKTALEKVNYITSRPEYVEDYHLSASLAAAGYGNVYADDILSDYRVWTDAGKVRQKRKLAEIIGLRRVFEEVLEPAFTTRNWNPMQLHKSRENFACNHAECLGWKVYNDAEKDELQQELYKLSSTPKVKLYARIYKSGFGKPIQFVNNVIRLIKEKIKNLVK